MRVDIRAIIMAGGEGVRLRPMTIHCPKPLVPLLGRPVMAYTLQLLKKHNISRVGVTLWYQPKKIRAAFGEGEKEGMKISYFEETEPLGTAGSVRMTREHIKDTFFVLSGDGLTDCDLTAALAYHKKKKALATLVLKKGAGSPGIRCRDDGQGWAHHPLCGKTGLEPGVYQSCQYRHLYSGTGNIFIHSRKRHAGLWKGRISFLAGSG